MKHALTASLALAAACTAVPAWAENCSDTGFVALAAADCRGSMVGELTGAAVEAAYLGTAWDGGWVFAGRSDDAGNGPFSGNPQLAFSGVLGFDTPISGDFILGLVAGGQHSFYRFSATTSISALTFSSTEGVATTPQGNPLDLSYAALYVTSVPEPGPVALLMAGLLAVGWTARRRA